MKFVKVPYNQVDWALLDSFPDRTFSQQKNWIEFICETQAGTPVIARLEDRGELRGFFTGVVVRRMGLRIMGSPFPGWTTPYMGFNLCEGVHRSDALCALIPFVFDDLKCHHLEVSDPYLSENDLLDNEVQLDSQRTLVSDLTLTEEQLFALMDGPVRTAIRKAQKSGVTIEEAQPQGFAEEHYVHLLDVFAKQNLQPTYGKERVEALIRHVYPSGNLLLLSAKDKEGRSIATGIFPGFNRISYFWANASLRPYQYLRPNEAMHWHAMRSWKSRKVHWHYWSPFSAYKRKYGGSDASMIAGRVSRNMIISLGRDMARAAYYSSRDAHSHIKSMSCAGLLQKVVSKMNYLKILCFILFGEALVTAEI
jgi:hypothetical protein